MGNEWATMDTVFPEKQSITRGTMPKGSVGAKVAFMMFNPPIREEMDPCKVRCGICLRGMDGFKSCPNCYP